MSISANSWGVNRTSNITKTLSKYKNSLNDFIDSLDTKSKHQLESPDQPRIINEATCNVYGYRGGLSTFLKKNCKDENILVSYLS